MRNELAELAGATTGQDRAAEMAATGLLIGPHRPNPFSDITGNLHVESFVLDLL
jgi:hypothetical protein